jgi:diacylglycerol kinase family enzyme
MPSNTGAAPTLAGGKWPMLVEVSSSAQQQLIPSLQTAVEPKVAVLLNANARQVTDRTLRALTHVVSPEDLFVSRSEIDARRIAQTVVDRRYDTVLCGGGDGTFVAFATEIIRQHKRAPAPRPRLPRFGVLKLGTGNGLASFVHASPQRGHGFLEDVLRVRSGEARPRTLDLLLVEGKRTPFAGVGADARLLNDYAWVKSNLGLGAAKHLVHGGLGYFSAVALKTLPYFLTHSTSVECEVTNGSHSPAYRLGPGGSPLGEPIAPGATLFTGKVMIAAAGTIPFYGYDFRIFPFAAKRPGMMHLRLGAEPPSRILANLPNLWRGRWFPAGIQDFHAREVRIRFDRPMPFQIGGDAEGFRDELLLELAPETVEVMDFGQVVH